MSTYITGKSISGFSQAVLISLAEEANIPSLIITSVKRTVPDQAKEFLKKHVLNGKDANYKNPEVKKIIEEGKLLHAAGTANSEVITSIASRLLNLIGGPETASRHLIQSPFIEVFDVAHYTLKDKKRVNNLSNIQALALLSACRKRYGFPIARLGISLELKPTGKYEFKDEQCFHFEMLQPVPDNSSKFSNLA